MDEIVIMKNKMSEQTKKYETEIFERDELIKILE